MVDKPKHIVYKCVVTKLKRYLMIKEEIKMIKTRKFSPRAFFINLAVAAIVIGMAPSVFFAVMLAFDNNLPWVLPKQG